MSTMINAQRFVIPPQSKTLNLTANDSIQYFTIVGENYAYVAPTVRYVMDPGRVTYGTITLQGALTSTGTFRDLATQAFISNNTNGDSLKTITWSATDSIKALPYYRVKVALQDSVTTTAICKVYAYIPNPVVPKTRYWSRPKSGTLVTGDGQSKWIDLSATPILDQSSEGYLYVVLTHTGTVAGNIYLYSSIDGVNYYSERIETWVDANATKIIGIANKKVPYIKIKFTQTAGQTGTSTFAYQFVWKSY